MKKVNPCIRTFYLRVSEKILAFFGPLAIEKCEPLQLKSAKCLLLFFWTLPHFHPTSEKCELSFRLLYICMRVYVCWCMCAYVYMCAYCMYVCVCVGICIHLTLPCPTRLDCWGKKKKVGPEEEKILPLKLRYDITYLNFGDENNSLLFLLLSLLKKKKNHTRTCSGPWRL